jgi:antitoxin YefM
METISYTSLRKNLSSIMDSIEDNHATFHVTRKDHPNMVMMREDDYNSLNETLYLLSNPVNAKHLQVSIKQVSENDFVDVDLDDES